MDAVVATGAGFAPWLWAGLALAFGLAGRRAALPLGLALAALACAALAWAAPGLPAAAQVGVFAFLALALALALRLRARPGEAARGAALVGRVAEAVAFSFHEGSVRIDGETWPARLDGSDRAVAPGTRLVVIASDGRVVWVRRA